MVIRAVALLLVPIAGCLAAPADGDGGPRLSNSRYRSIGDRSGPLATVTISPGSGPDRLVTSPDISSMVVPGQVLVTESANLFIAGVAGDELVLEEQIPIEEGPAELWNAFASISQWLSTLPADFTEAGFTEVGLVTQGEVLQGEIVIAGIVTDRDHRLVLTVPESLAHKGLGGDTGVTLKQTLDDSCIVVQAVAHVLIERLAFAGCGDGDGRAAIRLEAATDFIGDSLLIHDFASAVDVVIGVALRDGAEATIYNSFVYNGPIAVDVCATCTAVLYNLTVYGTTRDPVNADTGSETSVRNSIFMTLGAEDANHDPDIAVFENNITDYQAPNSTIAAPSELITSTGSGGTLIDLHLLPSAVLAMGTAWNYSDLFDHDIDGDIRSAQWDIGADQRTQ